MAKFVILGDMHIGVRNDNAVVMDHHIDFFRNQLIPYMEKNRITTILQVGDIFDRRKYTNHNTLYQWKTRVFHKLQPYYFYTILGNHDLPFKSTLDINTSELFLNEYENVHIITEPHVGRIEGTDMLLLPWLIESNQGKAFELIEKVSTQYVVGHLELQGFEMSKGVVCSHGILPSMFKQYDTVFSGHFHRKSQIGNIFYIGTPYEMSWDDFEEEKGFVVFDSDTQTYEYIKNESKFFNKIRFHNKLDIENFSYQKYDKTFIKVFIPADANKYLVDKFIDNLEKLDLADLRIIEEAPAIDSILEEEQIDHEDLRDLVNTIIDSLDEKNLVPDIKKYFHVLNTKIQEIE